MPEDLDNLEDDQPDQGGPKGLREALKREQDRAGAAEARLAQLERDAAFRDAGVDLTNPLHKAAAAGYDGDIDGIGAWVSDLGLTQSAPPPGVPDQEREKLERIFSASAGDGGAPAPDEQADGDNEMRQITDQARREGWTTARYHDEMKRISQKHGRPVQSMQIEQNFGATR